MLATVGACAPDSEEAPATRAHVEDALSNVRIVEVLSKPANPTPAFVELRNDGKDAVSFNHLRLSIDGQAQPLAPVKLFDQDSSAVEAHALALVVDNALPDEAIARLACESPIVTTRESLGAAHAAPDDGLVGSLELARDQRRCVPVFRREGLSASLAKASRVEVRAADVIDAANMPFASAAEGVSFERNGVAPNAFAPSPVGSTPGNRNFAASDPTELAQGEAAIRVMNAGPWRVGHDDRANGDPLPENPLTNEMAAVLGRAKSSAGAAFYQLNEPPVIDALIALRARGGQVEITSDAEFQFDRAYVDGWAKLSAGKVPTHFDTNEKGANRSALSHNKFLVIDDQLLWTGSYNPIVDDSARIHSDNAILFRSPELARLHTGELRTMFGGTYGRAKAKAGVAGGSAWVDGTQVIARFSPGLTDSQLRARAAELARTKDPHAACAVANRNGKPIIEARYSGLAPCGGPLDLLYQEVARAKSSIYFMQFSFALNGLADIIAERAANGHVEVKGVVDATLATQPLTRRLSELGDIRSTPNSDPGCPAYVTPRKSCPTNPNKVWLHHKFIVIDYGTDHPVVIMGSHNMSDSAEQQNDETLLVIRDRGVAEAYYRMFRESFDHPQTLGPKRPAAEAPALVIDRVMASASGSTAMVQVTNLEQRPVLLDGLVLWNRQDFAPLSGTIAPGGKAWLVFAGQKAIAKPDGVISVALPEGFVRPGRPLVLMGEGHSWLATFDPYLSKSSVVDGGAAWAPNTALGIGGVDAAMLDQLTIDLLGVNATPNQPTPTWTTRGKFSDWGDGYNVTRSGLALWKAHQATVHTVDFNDPNVQ